MRKSDRRRQSSTRIVFQIWITCLFGLTLIISFWVNALAAAEHTAALDVNRGISQSVPSRTPAPIQDVSDNQENAVKVIVDRNYCDNNDLLTVFPQTFSNPEDNDYFKFEAKINKVYVISVSAVLENEQLPIPAVDPNIVSVRDPNGLIKGSNDDAEIGSFNAKVSFTASSTGIHSILVSPGSYSEDNKEYGYCVEIVLAKEAITPSPAATSTPTSTPTPMSTLTPDRCEDNSSFDTACLIGMHITSTTTPETFSFKPVIDHGLDNDFYRIHLKAGMYVVCTTYDLSSKNDTNLIVYDPNGKGIGGNDDFYPIKEQIGKTIDARFGFPVNATGEYFILVGPGPGLIIPFEEAHEFTYILTCTQAEEPVPTHTITPTLSSTPLPTAITPQVSNNESQSESPSNEVVQNEQEEESDDKNNERDELNDSVPSRRIFFKSIATPTLEPATNTSRTYRPVTINISLLAQESNSESGLLNQKQPLSDMLILAFSDQEGAEQLLAYGMTNSAGHAILIVDEQLTEFTLKIPYFPFEKQLVIEDTIELVFSIDS